MFSMLRFLAPLLPWQIQVMHRQLVTDTVLLVGKATAYSIDMQVDVFLIPTCKISLITTPCCGKAPSAAADSLSLGREQDSPAGRKCRWWRGALSGWVSHFPPLRSTCRLESRVWWHYPLALVAHQGLSPCIGTRRFQKRAEASCWDVREPRRERKSLRRKQPLLVFLITHVYGREGKTKPACCALLSKTYEADYL